MATDKRLAWIVVVVAVCATVYLISSGLMNPGRVPDLAGGLEQDNRFIGEEDLERLYPDIILRAKRDAGKIICLTFDDGPDDLFTPDILDVLKEKNVKATFFLIGNRVEEYPEVTRRIVDEGHEIGNHTYSHPNTGKPMGQRLKEEIDNMEKTLAPFGVATSYLFRPPYGALSVPAVLEIANFGYRVAMWSIDSLDWRGLSKDEVINNIMTQVGPGKVVLQHSAGGPGEDLTGSVEALPVIIDRLAQDGYKFVTFSEMFPACVSQ